MSDTTDRDHRASHRQRALDLPACGVRQIRDVIGDLEVRLPKADRSVQAEMLDDNRCGLVHEDAGSRAAGMRHEVDEDVEAVLRNPPRGREVVAVGKPHEARRMRAKCLRGRVLVPCRADLKPRRPPANWPVSIRT